MLAVKVIAVVLVIMVGLAPTGFFPAGARGWRPLGEVQIYNRNSLFSYMNGAAEFYLAYDFKRLLVQRYGKEGATDIVAELYEMASSEDAFGVFHHDLSGERPSIGQMTALGDGELKFWTGSWMGRIAAPEVNSDVNAAIMEIGRWMAMRLPADGRKPRLLSVLPSGRGRAKESLRYFHTLLTLNRILFWPHEDALGLSRQTQCASAEYHWPTGKALLLVVRYPQEDATLAAHRALYARLHRGFTGKNPSRWRVKTAKGRWTAALRIGPYMALIPEGPDEERITGLMDEVAENLRKWN